jgi:alkylation response protein AidB-like acyl-CoA dehydrogenase
MQKTALREPMSATEELKRCTRSGYLAAPKSATQGADGAIRLGGMEFIFWLASIGKGRTVGWKWRKEGRVHCVNIDGKLYITEQEIDRFWKRAKAGEFAKPMSGVCREQTT